MKKQLMFWKDDVFRRGIDDTLGALFQCGFELLIRLEYVIEPTPGATYEGNDLRRLRNKSVCQLFVEGNEMPNVDIAVILFQENILSDLVSAAQVSV